MLQIAEINSTMDITLKQSDSPNSEPSKRRRKKSMVWDHFTIETVDADNTRAFCNKCKKSFAYISGSKIAGTSHLKRHISLGICPVKRNNNEKDELSPPTPVSRSNVSVNGTNRPRKRYRAANEVHLNEEYSGFEFTKMVIQHEYPIHMCEHSGFVNLVQALRPEFSVTSVDTVEEQISSIYSREKQKLLEFLHGIPGRLSLSLELYTSNQGVIYVLLTAHFVDHDWKLNRRILNFTRVPFSDSEKSFHSVVAGCLSDWNSEGKLFTIALDHSEDNEDAKRDLRGLQSIKNSVILNEQLIITRCYASILSRLAQDALNSMKETIDKVRHSVKYVKISKSREEKFMKLKQQLQVPSTKSLVTDDVTKWNTTFHMLTAASELKEVFSCLDTSDPDYKSTPSMEEWGQVEILCKYLQLLYEAANILTSQVYPTTNIFFHEVWKIQLELMQGATSRDLFVSHLTKPLLDKFTRYWENCNLVLAIAVVMDPRFKMKLVEFSFSRIYGENAENWIRTVNEGLQNLFIQYVVQCHPPPTFIEGSDTLIKTEMDTPQEDIILTNGDNYADFDIYVSDCPRVNWELDQYLEESLLPRVQDFDVLGWWKMNQSKYPTLSKMASDVLSIPLSTVSSDSVFDTRNKKIDSYRSSLKPDVLQALVCTKDWLHYQSKEIPDEIFTAVVKTEM